MTIVDRADPLFAFLPRPSQGVWHVGNYFNQELYGRPSSPRWALQIDPAHRPPDTPTVGTYQPTFAHELVWDLGVAALVAWAQRRLALSGWRSFALYVAAYTAGRGWIEALRDDHANHMLGLRLNDWTSILDFTAAVVWIVATRRQPPPGSSATPAAASRVDRFTGTDADTGTDRGPDTVRPTLDSGDGWAGAPRQPPAPPSDRDHASRP